MSNEPSNRPGWFQEMSRWSEERLRAMPREHLGPAARMLLDGMDRRDAERALESPGAPHSSPAERPPANVIRFPTERCRIPTKETPL